MDTFFSLFFNIRRIIATHLCIFDSLSHKMLTNPFHSIDQLPERERERERERGIL